MSVPLTPASEAIDAAPQAVPPPSAPAVAAAQPEAQTLTGPRAVVRIITRLNIGGPAIHVVELTRALTPPAFRSVLVAGSPDAAEGDHSGLARTAGIEWHCVPAMRRELDPVRDIAAWWQLFRLIRRERPDIVHTHTAKAGSLGRTAAMADNLLRRFGAWLAVRPVRTSRLVHTFHGHVLDGYFGRLSTAVFVGIERWLARHTDRIIAVSPAVRADLLRHGVGRPDQVRVVPLGLPLDPLLELDPPEASPALLRIGIVGRLVPIKQHELFLCAVSVCRKLPGGESLRFEIIGDGERRGELEAMAGSLGVADIVTFSGWAGDMAAVYRRLDIVALTSRNEGTPVSVIEALAASRPVVATDVGGVRDLLGPWDSTDGGMVRAAHGVLISSDDAAGLAAAWQYVATHPHERRAMGMRGRIFVRERFSVARLRADIAQLYKELGPCVS